MDKNNITQEDLRDNNYDLVHLSPTGTDASMKNFSYYYNYWLSDKVEIDQTLSEVDDLGLLMKTRRKNFQNPFFGYYNINSLRFKFNGRK